MGPERMKRGIGLALVLVAAGCGTVPEQTGDDQPRMVEPQTPEQPRERDGVTGAEPDVDQRQRETGSELAAAAESLLASADGMLSGGDVDRALNMAQRAQRISPDSAEVYYRLGRIHQAKGNYARAEQFVLKGLNKAGNDAELRRSGWSLLAEIRTRRGDKAGARQAREQASRF